MHVLTIDVPHLGNRTHLVHDGRVGVVIDPPRDLTAVESAAKGAGRGHRGGGGDAHPQRLRLRRTVPVPSTWRGVPRRSRRGGRVRPHRRARQRDPRVRRHRPARHRESRPHSAARVLPGDRRHPGGRRRRRAVQRRQPAGRHRRAHRPRRPHLATALARAQWLSAGRLGALPADTSLHPTHGFGSFCASAPADATRGEVTIAEQHETNTALTTATGHLRHEPARGFRAGAQPLRPHGAAQPVGPWTPRPATRLDHAAALEALNAGRTSWTCAAVSTTRPATCGHARDPRRTPVRGVRRLGDSVGSRPRLPLRLRGGRSTRSRASSPRSASKALRPRRSSRRSGEAGPPFVVRTGRGSSPSRPHRTPSSWTYDAPRSGAPGTSPAPSTSPSTSSPSGSTRSRPARSGCTARPATARRSRRACSTAPAATSCWSTTTSRRSASSEFPCWVRDLRREPLKTVAAGSGRSSTRSAST